VYRRLPDQQMRPLSISSSHLKESQKLTNTDEREGPVNKGNKEHLPVCVRSLVCVSSKIGLDVSVASRYAKERERERPTMFKARVVFPAMAILIPPTQAHDRADPVN
jgi:hypothetical protein